MYFALNAFLRLSDAICDSTDNRGPYSWLIYFWSVFFPLFTSLSTTIWVNKENLCDSTYSPAKLDVETSEKVFKCLSTLMFLSFLILCTHDGLIQSKENEENIFCRQIMISWTTLWQAFTNSSEYCSHFLSINFPGKTHESININVDHHNGKHKISSNSLEPKVPSCKVKKEIFMLILINIFSLFSEMHLQNLQTIELTRFLRKLVWSSMCVEREFSSVYITLEFTLVG